MIARFAIRSTPLGHALAVATEAGLRRLSFHDDPEAGLTRIADLMTGAALVEDPEALAPVFDRIVAFLEGRDEGDPPLDLAGTPFRRSVWNLLRAIPRGSTTTYGALARRLGVPGASRAVGAACGANPVALFVPCHRVLREGGGLGGYRWGLDRKRVLLDLERGLLVGA